MNRALVTAALAVGFAAAARADAPPVWPMRELIVRSETVVLAAPTDPAAPARFKVVRVLLGTALKEGDLCECDGWLSYDLTAAAEEGASTRKAIRPAAALLFLGPKKDATPVPRFPLTWSGLRVAAADGAVYHPEVVPNLVADPLHRTACYRLAPYRSDTTWDDLVRKADADAAEVGYVRSLKEIEDPRRRDRALLDWVERRRREFGGGLSLTNGEEPAGGWGSLEQQAFDWVFQGGVPADCWEAAKRYAELNDGATPRLQAPTFGNRTGRVLLLSVASDSTALAGDRARALELLALPPTLWPTAAEGQAAVAPLDETEQAALIDRVTPLLTDAGAAVRTAAAHVLLAAGAPGADDRKALRTDRALPALTAAYQAQPPGDLRDALAEAVCATGGAKRWEELTGNGHGVAAFVRDAGCREAAVVYGWWVLQRAGAVVAENPTLVLERLDDKDKAVEKKEVALAPPAVGPAPAGGWKTGAAEHFTISMADFKPGRWRMTVKGTAGADKASWVSEPRLLRLAPPPQPGQPNSDPDKPRITFDP